MFIPLAWLIIFFVLLFIFLIFICWCFFVVCQTPGTQSRFEDELLAKDKDQQQAPKTQSSIKLEVETIKIRQLEVMVEPSSSSTNLKPVPTAPKAEDVDSGGGGEGSSVTSNNPSTVLQIQTVDVPDTPKSGSVGDNLAPTEVIVAADKELEPKKEKPVDNGNVKRKKLYPVYETMI